MMFDNTPEPSPTHWQTVKSHLPLLLLGGGLAALFVGLHTAATAVAIAAVGHVVLAVALLAGRWLYNRHRRSAA